MILGTNVGVKGDTGSSDYGSSGESRQVSWSMLGILMKECSLPGIAVKKIQRIWRIMFPIFPGSHVGERRILPW